MSELEAVADKNKGNEIIYEQQQFGTTMVPM